MNIEEYFKDDWERVKQYDIGHNTLHSIIYKLWKNSEFILFKKYWNYDTSGGYINPNSIIEEIITEYIKLLNGDIKNGSAMKEEEMFLSYLLTTEAKINTIKKLKSVSVDYRKFL